MTIIVGIISKGAIILASDSQTTYDFSSKRCETDKITPLRFKSGEPALVAESGHATTSQRLVEILKELCSQSSLDDYRKLADLAQQAAQTVKKEIVELNNWKEKHDWPELLAKYVTDNPVTVMLGYYHKEKPYLFTLDLHTAHATRIYDFASIGCGGTVGDYILGQFINKNSEDVEALVMAIYAVEKVKKVDAYCDGQTKVAVLNPDGGGHITWGERALNLIRCTVETMAKYDEEQRKAWRIGMEKIILEAQQKHKEKYPDHPLG